MFRKVFFIVVTMLLCIGCTDGDRMRRDLARLEARNQADSLLTDSVLAQRLADYFAHHGTQAERLEAHYLLARTWADLGQAPRALDAYHTAAEQADTTRLDSLSCHFLSRIYGQIAKSLDDQIIPDKTLTALQQAICYARRANETNIVLNFIEQQVRPYYDLGIHDSVYSICSQLSKEYLRRGMKEQAVLSQSSRIYIDLQRENYEQVKTLLYKYTDLTEHIGINIAYAYSLLGKYHQGTGNLDSAIIYYHRQLELTDILAEKSVPYRGLYQCYKELGRSDSANKYSELYCMANDTSVIFKYRSTMQRMQHLYDYSHFQEQAYRKTIEARVANLRLLLLVLAIIVLTAVAVVWFIRYSARVKLMRQLMNARYVSTLLSYNAVRGELQRETQQNTAWRKQAEAELEQLRAALAEAQNDGRIPEQWDMDDKLFCSPVLVQFHQAAMQGRRMPDNVWMELRQLVNRELPGFMEKLSAFAYKPDMTETQIIILLRLRFLLSEIAVLLDVSSSALAMKRRRLLKKMFGIDGSATLFDQKVRLL